MKLTDLLSLDRNTGNRINGINTTTKDLQYIPRNALTRDVIIMTTDYTNSKLKKKSGKNICDPHKTTNCL